MINLLINGAGTWIGGTLVLVAATLSIFGLWFYGMYHALRVRNKNAVEKLRPLSFKINSFYKIVGGRKNIATAEENGSKIKLVFTDKSLVDIEMLKSLKSVSGILEMTNSITVILGPSAKTLAFEINEC